MSDSNQNPDTTNDPADSGDKAMGFWEHLEELRGTLVKSVIAFVVCASVIGYFIKEFNEQLMWPLQQVKEQYPNFVVDLGVQKITEVFSMIVQMCVLGGLVVAAPLILFFVGQFVAPALTAKEKKAIAPMCISALFLFLMGACFGFFLLMPKTIEVSLVLSDSFGLAIRWTIGDYYNTLSWLVLGVGAAFEFPLVIVLLVWMGVLSSAFLWKYHRHAIIVIFFIAAIITPTTDPITLTLFAAPLYVLFLVSIIVSRRVEKNREKRLAGQ